MEEKDIINIAISVGVIVVTLLLCRGVKCIHGHDWKYIKFTQYAFNGTKREYKCKKCGATKYE